MYILCIYALQNERSVHFLFVSFFKQKKENDYYICDVKTEVSSPPTSISVVHAEKNIDTSLAIMSKYIYRNINQQYLKYFCDS